MAWFWMVSFSAVMWGLAYVIIERLLQTMSPSGVMFGGTIGSLLIYAMVNWYKGDFKSDMAAIKSGGLEWKLLIGLMVVEALANLSIVEGVKAKNATLAGMVEISYPIFIVLFTWLIYREFHANIGSMIGFLLVAAGVCCIYYFEK